MATKAWNAERMAALMESYATLFGPSSLSDDQKNALVASMNSKGFPTTWESIRYDIPRVSSIV